MIGVSEPFWPHGLVRNEWLAQQEEVAIDPDMPIVDPHHHLWNMPSQRYMPDDFAADLGTGHNIRSTVFVECRSMYNDALGPLLAPVGETEWANGVAAEYASDPTSGVQMCAAIVPHADLRDAGVGEVLETHQARGGQRFRGIRYMAAWHPDARVGGSSRVAPPGLLVDPSFRRGFKQLHKFDLSFDVWAYFTQLDEVASLADAFPGTTIVLDHVGGVLGTGPYEGRRQQVFAAWRGSIQSLAQRPNVVVKLSGLGMRSCGFDFDREDLPPSSTDLEHHWRPYFEICVDAFGPQRCMFASNFPVDKVSTSYCTLWNAFKRFAARHTPEERTLMLHDTAAAVYRISGTQLAFRAEPGRAAAAQHQQ